MSARTIRWALVLLLAFIALTTLLGAFAVVPTLPRELIRWGPFTDFTVPAVALGLVGALAVFAVIAVVAAPAMGGLAAALVGACLALFEIVEVAVVGIALLDYPTAFQSYLQPFYFVLGVFVAGLGLELYRLRMGPGRLTSRYST